MSYDFWVEEPGADDPDRPSFNYTYNCAPMFHAGLTAGASLVHRSDEHPLSVHNLGGNLSMFKDVPCVEAAGPLLDAATWMDEHSEVLMPLNPANGWGDYESARKWLREFGDACAAHPTGWLRAWL